MSEDFMRAREALDIVDVAQRYGVRMARGNKAHCPFHTDRTPSMSFYEDNQKFHCFSCGVHGDAIDLVQMLLNLSSLEALQELNKTYGLGLALDTPPTPEKVRRAISAREKRQQGKELFQQWERGSFQILSAYFHTLREWKEKYAPGYPGEPLHPRFVEALHRLDYVEYLLDAVFICGTKAEKLAFFKSHEGFLRAIEQQLIWEGVSYAHRSEANFGAAAAFRPVIVEGGLRPVAAA